ncbi:cytochrome oxidase putative small subunit CydP [Methylomicrobium lacus]|uniref:cytochrome oxidase putative small subunit CydP n=1 Tax=Methylomicrobium lacus TaxID=136992 RepID=UPI0035A91F8B
MPNHESLFCPRQSKRDHSGRTDFRREITLALLVKFCLLGILWWSFFAGQKVPVDAPGVARAAGSSAETLTGET